jgi:hypothetical protein
MICGLLLLPRHCLFSYSLVHQILYGGADFVHCATPCHEDFGNSTDPVSLVTVMNLMGFDLRNRPFWYLSENLHCNTAVPSVLDRRLFEAWTFRYIVRQF